MIQQELGNLVPFEVPFATLLSQVEVDINDPAFKNPTKPIGPVYTKEEAERLAKEKNWSIAQDGDKYRRVVPSPLPKRIFEIRPVKWLLEKGSIVICAGGAVAFLPIMMSTIIYKVLKLLSTKIYVQLYLQKILMLIYSSSQLMFPQPS